MTKEKLIRELVSEGYIKTPAIREAFEAIDRIDFVPDEMKPYAYANQALPIGYGQTISQPLTVAFMLELLQPQEGEKILDIGTGSGWQAALLGYMLRNKGGGFGVERIKELVQTAKKNIGKYGFIEKGIVQVTHKDGSTGYAAHAPYHKIIAAAAGDGIPQAWKDQLRAGGNIVAPLGTSIIKLVKKSPEKWERQEYYGFRFVPLIKGTQST